MTRKDTTEYSGISRRTLLQGSAVLGAVALGGGASALLAQQAYAEGEGTQSGDTIIPSGTKEGVQYGFLVRTERCVNCQECVKACRRANGTPDDVAARRKVEQYKLNSGKKINISTSCMHCENPSCLQVCPAGAITKGEGGVVSVDSNRCIGCKYCYQACPYGVPHYTSEGMDKCDFCLEAGVALGQTPNCVKACKFRALSYGTLDELMAGSSNRAIQLEGKNGPSLLLQ